MCAYIYMLVYMSGMFICIYECVVCRGATTGGTGGYVPPL